MSNWQDRASKAEFNFHRMILQYHKKTYEALFSSHCTKAWKEKKFYVYYSLSFKRIWKE